MKEQLGNFMKRATKSELDTMELLERANILAHNISKLQTKKKTGKITEREIKELGEKESKLKEIQKKLKNRF